VISLPVIYVRANSVTVINVNQKGVYLSNHVNII
jgi:hypothetical protein